MVRRLAGYGKLSGLENRSRLVFGAIALDPAPATAYIGVNDVAEVVPRDNCEQPRSPTSFLVMMIKVSTYPVHPKVSRIAKLESNVKSSPNTPFAKSRRFAMLINAGERERPGHGRKGLMRSKPPPCSILPLWPFEGFRYA